MKLYNTLSRQLEELEPLNPPEVSVYTCGPTVYDYAHIGNWFTFIRYDLLIRTLKASGYEPKWVMNITDVGHLVSDADEGEDKLVKGALREGKTAWEIASFYTNYFTDSIKALNFLTPWQLPRATDHIAEQIALIKQLEAKGYTYKTSDGIYFDTSKFADYNRFARLDLDEQQAGARVEVNTEKRHPADFALWKFSPEAKQRDMEWDSPWGTGFPGWHIECSAICKKYFGDTLDIHSGGIDHVPVHHTNEIAQSVAANNKPLAKLWMHTNHILVDDVKISKSLGNAITLEQVKDAGFSLDSLRLMVIESHYRSQSHFSFTSLEAAQNRLHRFRNFAALRYQTKADATSAEPPDLLTPMQDDLNTPKALRVLEAFLDKHEAEPLNSPSILATVGLIDDLFGLKLAQEPDISDDLKQLISEREQARTNKDWLKADEIRNQLASQNISVKDSSSGPIWEYSN